LLKREKTKDRLPGAWLALRLQPWLIEKAAKRHGNLGKEKRKEFVAALPRSILRPRQQQGLARQA
jgi:hypothetical protein